MGVSGPQGPSGPTNFPFTGRPHVNTDAGSLCPRGVQVNGTDAVGQVIFPEGWEKYNCDMFFATPFKDAPICVASVAFPDIEANVEDVPAVGVATNAQTLHFMIGKTGRDMGGTMILNYICVERPTPLILENMLREGPKAQGTEYINSNSEPVDNKPILNPATKFLMAPWLFK